MNQPRGIAAPANPPEAGGAQQQRAALDPGFPNDPIFRDTRQWWLRNAGPGSAYNGKLGADIHVLDAWQITPAPPRAPPSRLPGDRPPGGDSGTGPTARFRP